MQPRRTWQRAALLGLVLLTGLGATSLAASALAPLAAPSPPSVLGLRLGATPDMVRARLGSTSFRTELGEDVALVADAPISDDVAPGARFEFHDGQLVAVRVDLRAGHDDASGDAAPGASRPGGSVDAARADRPRRSAHRYRPAFST